MNRLIRCCCRLAALVPLTLLLSSNAPAAPRAHQTTNVSPAASGWCVDDLCLGQPESVLKPYAALEMPSRPVATCPQASRRYAIPRTDGSLEVVIDPTGKVAEIERGYSYPVTGAQFDQMLQDSARKLSAKTVSRVTHSDGTTVHLRNAAVHADMQLRYAPSHAAPLSVRLTSTSESCDASAAPVTASPVVAEVRLPSQ